MPLHQRFDASCSRLTICILMFLLAISTRIHCVAASSQLGAPRRQRSSNDWGIIRQGSNSGLSGATRSLSLVQNTTVPLVTSYTGSSEHPACAFLRSRPKQHSGAFKRQWGSGHRMCIDDTAVRWLRRSRSNCYSCTYPDRNMCTDTTKTIYHMSLNHLHPTNPQGNLLAIQAYLMTQDLSRSRLMMWVLHREQVYTDASAWLFDAFSDHVSIQQFDYEEAIKGTVWQHDAFLGNHTLVQQYITNAACYSDLMRMLILHKYGGLWVDTDVIFYQDLTHLMRVSYQFVMRPVNNHIMKMEAGSALTHRMLQLATTMPMNHPNFKTDIIDNLCARVGYAHIKHEDFGNMDIYNFCLLRLLLLHNNTGPPDAILYDLPTGWFDQDWDPHWQCYSRKRVRDSMWEKVASSYLCMHHHYPRKPGLGPEGSPLRRAIRIIQGFFETCRSTDCLPLQGLPLLAYEGLHDQPPERRRRLLRQLK